MATVAAHETEGALLHAHKHVPSAKPSTELGRCVAAWPCTGCANKKQSPRKNSTSYFKDFFGIVADFFHQIYAVYTGGFRPCIQQIAFKYLT